MIRAIYITICIALIANSTLLASEPPIRTGARALGLCNTFTALADDSSAPLWNSAGVAKIDRFNLELNLFGDLLAMSYRLGNYGAISAYAVSLEDSNFIPIFDTDAEQDNQFGVAYGKRLGGFMLGAGIDYRKSIAEKDIGLNTGFILTPIPQLSFGMDLRLFFDEVSKQEKKLSYLAKRTTFGIAFRPVEYLKYRSLDAVLLGSVDANMNQLAFGTELKYRAFSVRGGTSFKIGITDKVEPRFTVGLGLDFDYLQLNYVYLNEPISNDRQYAASITLSYPKRPPKFKMSTHSIPVTSISVPEITHAKIEPLDSKWPYKPSFNRYLFQLESKPKYPQLEIAIALTQRYPWHPQRIRYVIKTGDSLWNICQEYKDRILPKKYRNSKELAKLNNIDDPTRIRPGDVIFIPVAQDADQKPERGYKPALEKFNRVLEKDPNDPVILNNLAVVLVKRSEFYSALEKLEKASKIAPTHPILNSNLGLLYIYAGRNDLAERHLKKAAKSMPKLAAVHCNLGLLYLEKDEVDKAISEFTTSISLDEKCLDAMYNLSVAYEKKGMKEEARQTLRRLAEIVLDYPQVKTSR